MKKWEKLNESELRQIFAESTSKQEVARKINYCKDNSIPLNIIKYNEKITLERVLNFLWN